MSNPKILAVVPARGGSKGIPGKNIKVLNGKPLLAYAAEGALGSQYITRTVLSTDDEKIAEVGTSLGLEVPFLRPTNLSQDFSPTLPAIIHAVTFMEEKESFFPDYVVILQPTSPFRTSQHIDESLQALINSDADSIVSVTDVPHSFNPYSVMKEKNGLLEAFLNYDEKDNMRQKKPVFYGRNGAAIYAFRRDCLMEKNSIYGDKILPYFMDKKTSLDIDDEWDWQMAVLILENKLLSSE
jgi:CMP-N-acetylneuraminic acid synthetase